MTGFKFNLVFCLFGLITLAARGDDWPVFGRDATRNPVSPEKDPPLWWQIEDRDRNKIIKSGKNILWQVELAGPTRSDPVVADGRLWIGVCSPTPGEKDNGGRLQCYRVSDGKLLYQYVTPPINAVHSHLSEELAYYGHTSVPLIEGDRLYFLTNRYETVCLDTEPLRRGQGEPKEVWKVDLVKTLGIYPPPPVMGFGRACSIAPSYKDRIFVSTGHGPSDDGKFKNPRAPSLVCFDKNTGKVLWQDSSPGTDILEGQWASPLVAEVDGRYQVMIVQGDGWLRSFDALSGAMIWKCNTNPPSLVKTAELYSGLSAPVYHEGRVYVGNGRSPHSPLSKDTCQLLCVDPTGSGDVSLEDAMGQRNPNSRVVWRFGGKKKVGRGNLFHGTMANVAVSRGLAVVPDNYGYLHCLDARTGQLFWTYDTRDPIVSSPLIVDDKIFVSTDHGECLIFLLAKEMKLLGNVDLDNPAHSAPIYANSVLYIAAYKKLFAIQGREQPPPVTSKAWPNWRGPNRTNMATDTGLLKTWPAAGPPLSWKATGLGEGVASLSAGAGRIFTLGTFDKQEYLLALKQSDGSLLWKVQIGPASPGLGNMQWLSQRTPTLDDASDLVWGISAMGILVCCQASTGRELWRKDYIQDLEGKRGPWGFSDYPLVDGDHLICTPGGDKATLIALDKRTGAMVWRCPIPGECSNYGAVVPFIIDGRRYFAHQLNKGAVIVSANGKLVWQGVKQVGSGSGNVQTTLVRDNLLFFANGWNGNCALIKVTPGKEELDVEQVYNTRHPFDQWLGSAVLIEEKVFTSCGHCIDLRTGKNLYRRLPEIAPRISMTYADGRFIYRTGENHLLLLEAGDEGWIKRGDFTIPMAAKGITSAWTFPIVVGGKLYLRDQDVLHCYDLRDMKDKLRHPDAIFVPTPQDVVDKMLDLARAQKKDVVYDLGCGDGRIAITAAKKYGCKAVGIDIDPECVRLARGNVQDDKLEALVRIDHADLFETDLSQADVVALYLLPKLNVKLLPQLDKLKPGSRIVSHQFAIEGIPADQEIRYRSTEDGIEHTLHLWTTPLKRKAADPSRHLSPKFSTFRQAGLHHARILQPPCRQKWPRQPVNGCVPDEACGHGVGYSRDKRHRSLTE